MSSLQPGDMVLDLRPKTRHLMRQGRITGLGEDFGFGTYAVVDFGVSTENVLPSNLKLVSSAKDAAPQINQPARR